MSRTTARMSLTACGLIMALGLAAGQPPAAPRGPVKLASRVSVDPAEIAKIYGHITFDEMQAWWKKYPSNEAEVNQVLRDMAEAIKYYEEANGYYAAGQPAKAKEAMAKCLAGFLQHFQPDSPMVADLYGAFGVVLSRMGDVPGADDAFRKQRACMDRVFPPSRFPDGHKRLALFLLTSGSGQLELGRHSAAETAFREALRMYRKFGPANPNGSDMTTLLIQLSGALFIRKEYAEAETLAREALTRCEELCRTPEGRAKYLDLQATAKNNLSLILRARGESVEADRLLADAVELRRGQSVRGRLGFTLGNQADAAIDNQQFSQALTLSDEALQAMEAAYPASEYPRGHQDLETVLLIRGKALMAAGDRVAARQTFFRCLEMVRALYPDDRCPNGHPSLALILIKLADLHLRFPAPEDQRAAAQFFRDSLNISLGHTRAQAAYLSEADMLQQLSSAAGATDGLLSVTGPFDSRDYWYLWESKAAAMRMLDYRRRSAVESNNPAVKELLRQLAEVRSELAAKALAPAIDPGTSGPPTDLSRKKEDLEARLALAQGLPLPPRNEAGPGVLAEALPPTAAFVDFWIYHRIEQDPANSGDTGRRMSLHYAAFVLTRRGELARVELGPASVIDDAIDAWLVAISQNSYDPIRERDAAVKVANLVWKPLGDFLPRAVNTVYVCPDGAFGRLPFTALPDRTGDKVLLEELKVVEVPHGPGLLAWLTAPPLTTLKGPILAIGAVDYSPGRLQFLPGTEKEIRAVGLAASVGRIDPVYTLTGPNATADQVLAKLAIARVAHFATHASANGADLAPGAVSAVTFHRNPFIGCRLALSGANVGGASGVLVGETIAGQRLNDLDLVVLSACDSALGTAIAGEGVYALRRAFHAAGCRAVVASLWPVDDLSTAALMTRFYHHLWLGRLAPDDALHEAQLDLYHSPREIPEWAEGRRGNPRVVGTVPLPPAPRVIRDNLPRKWAGFQLSINHY